MSVELAIRGPEKWVRNEKSGMFARVFRWMDASERQWKRRHAREVSLPSPETLESAGSGVRIEHPGIARTPFANGVPHPLQRF